MVRHFNQIWRLQTSPEQPQIREQLMLDELLEPVTPDRVPARGESDATPSTSAAISPPDGTDSTEEGGFVTPPESTIETAIEVPQRENLTTTALRDALAQPIHRSQRQGAQKVGYRALAGLPSLRRERSSRGGCNAGD